jgi:hypothetical protein
MQEFVFEKWQSTGILFDNITTSLLKKSCEFPLYHHWLCKAPSAVQKANVKKTPNLDEYIKIEERNF